MTLREFHLDTDKEGFYDITGQVAETIIESGVKDGLCVVFSPHTTAGITVNENTDPDVRRDLLLGLHNAFPDHRGFRHGEGNSAAHLKASAVGASRALIVAGGKPLLGTWQAVYFCEFDGPRQRRYFVKVV
ncbi:MAG: secondary thiamine-phosphate synthase enzyme YjbQ [Planctomycetota bacterium]|jgi:secondary thiamine-phosphate synthase enzyme|nr:secondary thiamine-phosphate synthase enzyme YjbQ [Planctomycetota bacterium]